MTYPPTTLAPSDLTRASYAIVIHPNGGYAWHKHLAAGGAAYGASQTLEAAIAQARRLIAARGGVPTQLELLEVTV